MALWDNFFERKTGFGRGRPPALFHYVKQAAGEKSRIHLRLDEGGEGTLMVNANRVLHLNPTAALMAQLILEGRSTRQIIRAATRK